MSVNSGQAQVAPFRTFIEPKEYLRSQKDLYKDLANGTHGLGVCLDFILRESIKDPEITLYEYIRERVYVSEYITNYPEIVTWPDSVREVSQIYKSI